MDMLMLCAPTHQHAQTHTRTHAQICTPKHLVEDAVFLNSLSWETMSTKLFFSHHPNLILQARVQADVADSP